MTSIQTQPLRLSDAGDAKPAWIILLTTEHYNLQTQRAATISEANGRASIFLGALSAGLIALGFQSAAGRTAGTTIFQVLVLSSLAFLGVVALLRCLEISIDDWPFTLRITALRAAYAQLVPELADLLLVATGSIGVITSVVAGSDIGVLTYGLGAPLAAAIPAGTVTALLAVYASTRFQRARWKGATASEPSLA
jgi:hypothetical protein